MRNYRIRTILTSLIAVALVLACTSCMHEPAAMEETFLSVSVSNAARTVLPEYNLNNMTYTLKGKLDGGPEKILGTFDSYQVLITDKIPLEKGNWEFTLEASALFEYTPVEGWWKEYGAYVDNNWIHTDGPFRIKGSLFKGTTTKEIQQGQNSIAFMLSFDSTLNTNNMYYHAVKDDNNSWTYIPYTGAVDVKLNLPADSNVYVKAILKDMDSNSNWNITTDYEVLNVTDNAVTFKNEHVPLNSCSYYEVVFEIYDGANCATLVNTYKELVKIIPGCVSKAERTLETINDTFYELTLVIGEGEYVSGYVPPTHFVSSQQQKLPDATQISGPEGYVLEGWYDNEEFTGKRYYSVKDLNSSLTLYAHFVSGILLTQEDVSSFQLSSYASPLTVVYTGTDVYALREKLDNDSKLVNLILTSVTLPESLTRLDSFAFQGCSSLQFIVIPEGVTDIGDYAFSDCSSLTSVVIPEGVTSIGVNAFYDCSSLTSVVIPEGVTSIGDYTFDNCSKLTSVVIPEGVTSIGDRAFSNCSSLTSVVIPEGVTSIGDYAFSDCSSLTSVTLPSTLKSIGVSAFYNCSNISELHVHDIQSYLSIDVSADGHPFYYSQASTCKVFVGNQEITNLVIPEGVTSIGAYAFYRCSSLTSVVIPEGVTSIGYKAFYNCSKLTSVDIPEGVTDIGYYAFSDCSSLTSVTLPSTLKSIGYAFSYCSKISELHVHDILSYLSIDVSQGGYPFYYSQASTCKVFVGNQEITDLVIPEGVTSIGDGAFSDCGSLTSVVIPEGVTSIGNYAFSDCSSLTSVVIPEGVTEIGEKAFYNCSSLTSVVIPEGVTSIGYKAFYNCSKLTSVDIPEGVTDIGYYAFYNCSSLTSVVIPEGVTSIGVNAFYNCSSLTSVTLPSTLKSIGYVAFGSCRKISELHVHDIQSYLSIDVSADGHPFYYSQASTCKVFVGNQEITDLVIPEGVTSIGNYAFSDCSSLTSVVIPEGVTSIGNYAFSDCSSLTSVVIPEGVTSIGDYAFYNCSKLTSVTLPSTLKSIGYVAFGNCRKISELHVHDIQSYLSIDVSADGHPFYYSQASTCKVFVGNQEITDLVIPEGVTSIGDRAFSYCSSLTSVVIPEGVTSIGDRAFYNCSKLTSVALPSTLKSIESYAFGGCSSLTSIVIPEGVTSIGENAFSFCSSLTSVVIPKGVTSIGDYAFYYCNLSSVTIPEIANNTDAFNDGVTINYY